MKLLSLLNGRTFFISLIAFCFGASLLKAELPEVATATTIKSRPNIFFFFADDWGKYAGIHSEVAINRVIETPAFDQLAQEGVRFTNAHVNAPTCTASRSALFSGQYFFRTGFGAFLYGKQWNSSIPTYPLLLKDAGYFIGHTYKGWSPGAPVDAPLGGREHAYNKRGTRFNTFSQQVTAMVAGGMESEEAKEVLYREALGNFEDFLDKRPDNSPFCYYFGPTNTHRAWEQGSGKKLWNIDPDKLEGLLPEFLPDVPEIREDVADYLGEACALDAVLGQFVEKLKEMGELDNTIIVVSGDHGIPGFPRAKSNLYEIGTNVALLIRWGDEIGKNRELTDFVNLTDIAPTFLEVAGVPVPECMTGRSLLPILTESRESGRIDSGRDYVVTGRERHFMTARAGNLSYPSRAIRTDDYLYIRNFHPERSPQGDPLPFPRNADFDHDTTRFNYGAPFADLDGGPTKIWLLEHFFDPHRQRIMELAVGFRPEEELYDLRLDPDYMNNVAQSPEYRKIREEHASRLMTILTETSDPRVIEDGSLFDSPVFVDQWSAWSIPSPEEETHRQ